MHNFKSFYVMLSVLCVPLTSTAYNYFGVKVEGGYNMTPEGLVTKDSTLQAGDTDSFSTRWESDTKTDKKSLLSKNKTKNTGYVGVGVITRSHPAVPVRGELLFGYYPKYNISYHGKDVPGFPATASLTTQLERYTVFLNAYIDALKIKAPNNTFDFYIQGGIGAASNHMKNVMVSGATDNYNLTRQTDSKSSNDNRLAWNIGLGMNFSFNDRYSFGLGYRYINFNPVQSSNVSLNSTGTWDTTRKPFNIQTYSHMLYLSAAIF